MPETTLKVAHGLVLYGEQIADRVLTRRDLLELVGVRDSSFRSAGVELGATSKGEYLPFFNSSPGMLRFGPGAGLVLAIAVGRSSLRAALVDANGDLHHRYEAAPQPEQSELRPAQMLDRIRAAAAAVLEPAFHDLTLLVGGALPLLGVATAWGSPVDRSGRPAGALLRDPSWQVTSLAARVADQLRLPRDRSHAIGIANACAIAVAWHESRTLKAHRRAQPQLQMVVRLGGTVEGASVVIEPPSVSGVSGFLYSVLMAGEDGLAGAIGHLPVERALVRDLNEQRPGSLAALAPRACSCGADDSFAHLETFASTPAVARRLDPEGTEPRVLAAILVEPHAPAHDRALSDVGALLGQALTGPCAMLNPSAITLTGPLALPRVSDAVMDRLAGARLLGALPEVRRFDSEADRFLAIQGAGLVVLRKYLYRRFEELIGGPRKQAPFLVRQLTHPLRPEEQWGGSSLGAREG